MSMTIHVISKIILIKTLFLVSFFFGIGLFAAQSTQVPVFAVSEEPSFLQNIGEDIFSSSPSSVDIEPEYLEVEAVNDFTPTEEEVLGVKTIKDINIEPIASKNSTLTISKIGISNQDLTYSSALTMEDIDSKLLEGPVVENQLTSDLCTPNKNSYIYGHSEPVYKSTSHHNGVAIFEDLTTLVSGDVIEVINESGTKCTYKVKHWETAVTEADGKGVSIETFNRVFNPEEVGNGFLTIQTCKKGSTTVRMILRAELVL